MKSVATMVLQRNLPDITDILGDHIIKWNDDLTDLYVIESGSDDDKLSKFIDTTFHADWPEAKKMGLHFPRGFNYGLLELAKLNKDYEYIMLCMGDVQLYDEPTVEIILSEFERLPRAGIIAPISPYHGDTKQLLDTNRTKAHWLMPHICWVFRRELIDKIAKQNDDYTIMGYMYDGTNKRGYDTDTSLILQAYQNDYCFCVTDKAKHHEIADLTEKNYERMKTEPFNEHLDLMFKEGLAWLKKKYGFDSKQPMRDWARQEYNSFFMRHPELQDLKL